MQLDHQDFAVHTNMGRIHVAPNSYYLPDLCVIPYATVRRMLAEQPDRLEVHHEPLPLIVETWAIPSGGLTPEVIRFGSDDCFVEVSWPPTREEYDVDAKLTEYRIRGDAEVWHIDPYEPILTVWRRQAGGGYAETRHQTGTVQPVVFPGVTVDVGTLFERK